MGGLGLAYADLGKVHKAIESTMSRPLAITREIGDKEMKEYGWSSLGLAYADPGEAHQGHRIP